MSVKNPQQQRKYLHLKEPSAITQELIAQININDKFLIVLYNNQSRFLLNDDTLVIINNASSTQVYNQINNITPINYENNQLIFGLGTGHAYLKIECIQCDNGQPYVMFYDLNGKIIKSQNKPLTGKLDDIYPILRFNLSDQQALTVFNTFERLFEESQQGTYKYVDIIHNCVAILTDTYKQSGFNGHYSEYFKDEELLTQKHPDTAIPSIVHRYYYPSDYIHPDRSAVSELVTSILKEIYKEAWKSGVYTNIDLKKVDGNDFISSKIEDVLQTRKIYLPELIRESIKLSEINNELSEEDTNNIVNYMLQKPVMYSELYYSYTLEHETEILNLFKDTIYYNKVVEWLDNGLSNLCADYRNPTPATFDRVCTMWCQTQEENLSSCDKYLSPNNSHQLCGLTIDSLYIV